MAKKPKDAEDQLQLIETDHPFTKKFKSMRRSRDTYRSQQHEAKQKADEKEEEILASIRELGIKPDINGVISFNLGGELVTIKPGKAQLKIKEMDGEAVEGDEDYADGEPGDD